MLSKLCARCLYILPLEQFGVDRHKRDGRAIYCKACNREKSKEAYANPATRARKLKTEYQKYHDNRKSILARMNARNAAKRAAKESQS